MPKIKFEKTLLIGSGKITWYQKAERWVRRKFKNPFTQHLLLGIIKYLQTQWINAKIYNTMKDVDADIEKIQSQWEENDQQTRHNIVERGVFGDEAWSIQITNPVVERGSEATSTGMVTGSNAQRLRKDERDQTQIRQESSELPKQSPRILQGNEGSRSIIPDPWLDYESGTDTGDVEKGFSN